MFTWNQFQHIVSVIWSDDERESRRYSTLYFEVELLMRRWARETGMLLNEGKRKEAISFLWRKSK